MAIRRVTHRFPDLATFMGEYEAQLKDGFCLLPASAIKAELANPLKLDLMIPLIGRVGPLTAQVVSRPPDGSAALQLPDFDAVAGKAIGKLLAQIEDVRAWLVESGQLVEPGAAVAAPPAEVAETLALEEDDGFALPPDDGPAVEAPALEIEDEGEVEGATEAVDEALDALLAEDAPEDSAAAPTVVRGIPVPDLSAAHPLFVHALTPHLLRQSLIQLASDRRTGILTLRSGEGRVRYGFWLEGGPVAWRTDPVPESEVLGMLLLKGGQITKDQLKQSLQIMQSTGCRQGQAFLEMGVMEPNQLTMVLGKQVAYVFQMVLRESGGECSFHELTRLPETFLPPPLPVSAQLLRSLMNAAKELRGDQMAEALRPHFDSYAKLHPRAVPLLPGFKFSRNEERLIQVFQDMNLRVREVFSVSPVSRQATAGMLYAFIQLGLLDFQAEESREAYLQRVSTLILAKRRRLMKSNHFETLESHWITLPAELDTNYQRLQHEYGLETYEDLTPEMMEDLRHIQARLAEAYEVLRDEARRREYRKSLLEAFMIEQSAELLAKKGEMAVMRQDRRVAVDCFSKACELMPKVPAYRTSLQRARAI